MLRYWINLYILSQYPWDTEQDGSDLQGYLWSLSVKYLFHCLRRMLVVLFVYTGCIEPSYVLVLIAISRRVEGIQEWIADFSYSAKKLCKFYFLKKKQ